ncbi:MAG: Transglycosylase SLT domain protein [Candidatus Methanoperedenaceae archaeon GB50]|nr:MAG: Transglycosylase SLT domain protein [Candidatus Methanoperedenaceae archaeon GB50]
MRKKRLLKKTPLITKKISPKKKVATIPIVINDRVQTFINYYTKNPNGRRWFHQVLTRAQEYKPLMEKILLKAGLPKEVFYLAFVESGFDNHAYSYAHACGPWQFIASTATHYGLKIDYWVDERKDPELATKAAARYLKDLYSQFKDWYLTAAAYNAGNGTIQRLIKRYKVSDYWTLIKKAKELKLETKTICS